MTANADLLARGRTIKFHHLGFPEHCELLPSVRFSWVSAPTPTPTCVHIPSEIGADPLKQDRASGDSCSSANALPTLQISRGMDGLWGQQWCCLAQALTNSNYILQAISPHNFSTKPVTTTWPAAPPSDKHTISTRKFRANKLSKLL